MSQLWRSGEQDAVNEAALPVVLVGEGYRRAYAKHLLEHPLADHMKAVGELASGRRVEFLDEIGPKVVVLDCASEVINPLAVLPRLAALEGSPRVVALVDDVAALDERVLLDLGADVIADIQDPHALSEAVRLHDPLEGRPPEDTRRAKNLTTAA